MRFVALSKSGTRFCGLLIGLAKKKNKRRFPLVRVEGTILQIFPGLWLA
jgi:hypothetical protein